MLDKLLGSIFDFASTPRGLLSILAGVASAKDRRRDTPAYGGGVSYGMPGPRRLEAVKGLGRYADVMGFSNGGQTVDIRQPLRFGYAQGPYGPLLAYDIPDMAPTPAPVADAEAPRQTQTTQASEGYEGIGELSDYMKNETFEQQSARNAKLNDILTNLAASSMTLSPQALAAKGLGNAAQYGLGKFLNSMPGAMSGNAPIESRDSYSLDALAETLGISPQATAAMLASDAIEDDRAAQMEAYGSNRGDSYGGSYDPFEGSYDPSGGSLSEAGGYGGAQGSDGYYSPEWKDGGPVRSYARGGAVRPFPMQDGGFVLTKRAVDGAGGPRGLAAVAPHARMIRGPGTGTSDSIPATIQGRNGVTPAKVSNGEAYVPPEGVEQAGGARQMYALMNNLQRRA